MAHATFKNIIMGLSVAGLTACQAPMYAQHQFQPMPSVDMAHLNQMAQMDASFQQGQMQPPAMGNQAMPLQHTQHSVLVTTEAEQRLSAVTAQLSELQDRLSRTERAMLRLDRRMQLVEANELSRMDGAQMSALESQASPVSMVGQSIEQLSGAPEAQGSLMPVSMTNFMQNQQVASRQQQGSLQQANNMQGGSALLGLPSLADTERATSNDAPAELSVWTVVYQGRKIWPERAQLKSSRDVVTALRNSDRPVAVYARGKHTNSKEFRERVRAISRYLSKVTEREQVPIAALPADHLDGDTIEIFTAN